MNNKIWLLPEGVEEILPDQAAQLERLRRVLLDDLGQRGFLLVMPPVMEFVDSLLTGTGEALDTQTYKFMDQHTHRMLGVRADMTPQIARIDAHHFSDHSENRFCYAGTVLRTQPEEMGGQRELLQIGAELFGVSDHRADHEIIDALLSMLSLSEVGSVTLSLSHVSIQKALLENLNAPEDVEARLFDILLRKSFPDLSALASEYQNQIDFKPFSELMTLHGGDEIVSQAKSRLPNISEIDAALDQLDDVITHLRQYHSGINIHLDLADVFGYRYHTGLKFAAYTDGRGRTIAKGGRYDAIGKQFGRARPATGFSADLKTLAKLGD